MMGREQALNLATAVRKLAAGDAVEVKITGIQHSLTRFARSIIHQSVNDTDVTVCVRIMQDGAVGQAECNSITDDALASVVRQATRAAKEAPPTPDPVVMADRQEYCQLPSFTDQVLSFGAAARARGVQKIITVAAAAGGEAAGAISCQLNEQAIVNTQGAEAYQLTSEADALAVITAHGQSGYARRVTADPTTCDFTALAEEAVSKCLSCSLQQLDPGVYTVVLEPYAVGDMVMALSLMGCGADAVQQGRSFMCSRTGQQVADKGVTIYDDALDCRSLPSAFDQEAIAKQRTMLIEKGNVCGPVYDLATAARDNTQSTGHAGVHGPTAANLFMAGGSKTTSDMIADIDRGILVTRFHYIAIVNAAQTAWSGMTRDGTLLIERGRITKPIVNMRFSDQILSMLSAVRAISTERQLTRGYVGCAFVPALLIDQFKFTGATM